MLKQQTLIPVPNHEELFIQRYERLLGWALQLTKGNTYQAKDLVQEAYVQFTLHRRDLNDIENLDGYLRRMLRNLHLSQVRRAARGPQSFNSLINFDTAEIGLRANDLRAQAQIQEELHLICHYACVRKETSKAGSVMLLRFFHGYYPSEAAQILRTPRQVVDNWLRIARREAKLYLENPSALSFMTREPTVSVPPVIFKGSTLDLFNELRVSIIQSRQGECFSTRQLRQLYRLEKSGAIDAPILAHIVSCLRCLDEVNQLLGLSPLSDRHPPDMLGPGAGTSSGSSGDATGEDAMRPNATEQYLKECRHLAQVTYEHRPETLEFFVNGFPLSSCRIEYERSQQTVTINIEEKISFVEVFSEQGIRLCLLDIEVPPDGPATLATRVHLSDGRYLQLTLNFDTPWPSLHTFYQDPLLKEGLVAQTIIVDEATVAPELSEDNQQSIAHPRFSSLTASLRRRLVQPQWLRPRTVTAVVSLILIAALVFALYRGSSNLSAPDLLLQARATEEMLVKDKDQVVHRTLNLEEIALTDSRVISRHRVEVWKSEANGARARRVYDEKNQLVAGEWRQVDGSYRIYRRGVRPQIEPGLESSIINAESIWKLEPSAKEFSTLIESADMATVEENSSEYIISYKSKSDSYSCGVLSATLTLNKSDLHAVGQTLLIREEITERHYRITETGFNRIPSGAVTPEVFQPDPELLAGIYDGESIPEQFTNKIKSSVTESGTFALLFGRLISADSKRRAQVEALNHLASAAFTLETSVLGQLCMERLS
jgi:RNA polymerase sigma factor (sigma-70 family)